MQYIKKGLSVLLLTALLLGVVVLQGTAADAEDFGVQYVNEDSVIITGYGGTDTALEIPAQIGGRRVIGLDKDAFADNTVIRSITLPNTITELTDEQFSFCTALEEVHLCEGLERIGVSAFFGCAALRSIHIPDSVTSLGVSAFASCTALQTIRIGDGVQKLSARLFESCTALKTVYFGKNVESITDDTFQLCFADGGDLYIFEKTTVFSDEALSGARNLVIHCYPGSPIEQIAAEGGYYTETFAVSGIRAVCAQPVSVVCSQTPQAVPREGVQVIAAFVQPDGVEIPEKDVAAFAQFPALQIFDTAGTAYVTVSFAGFSDAYPVSVVREDTQEPIRLRIADAPAKTTYPALPAVQTIEYAGLRVMLVYSDGSETDVTADVEKPQTCLFDQIGRGEAQRVPVRYTLPNGSVMTEYLQMEVVPEKLGGIELVNAPTAGTVYFTADNAQKIDTAGMKVIARCGYEQTDPKTGSTEWISTTDKDVTAQCTIPDMQLTQAGTVQVPVSFGGFSVSFSVTVRDTQIGLVADGKAFTGDYKKKIPLFGSYQTNPVTFGFVLPDGMTVVEEKWSVSGNDRMRMAGGTLTMRGLFAGAGRVTLTLTDSRGGVHTVSANVLFYRFTLFARMMFRQYF